MRALLYAALLLAVASLALADQGESARRRMYEGQPPSGIGDAWDTIPRRHLYKQSFKKPFFLYNTSKEVPHFEPYGSVIASGDYIRLTSSVPNLKGGIWSKVQNEHKQWQVEIAFQVNGRAYLGGEGWAFWYTKERMEAGDLLGNRDAWHGLGVLFDTSDPQENRNTPYVYAAYNDGTRHLQGQKATQIANNGACFRDYRNMGKVWARITYVNHTLRVDIDAKGGHGQTRHYIECFTTTNFPDLPTNYHFGLTAMTGYRGADDHDIYAFESYELYPPNFDPSKLPKRPYEEDHEKKGQAFHYSSEAEKKMEKIELADDDEEPEAMTPQLARSIQETQLKIIESLNVLHTQLAANPLRNQGSAPASTGGTINTAIIEHKIDELTSKLASTESEFRQLKEIVGRQMGAAGKPGPGGNHGPGAGGAGADPECRRMLSDIQQTLRSLGSQTSHITTQNAALTEKTSSLTWYATILGVVLLQAILSWAWSVVTRSRQREEKKFI